MSNFASILSRPVTDFERPKPMPQGTYVMVTSGVPRQDKSNKKQTPFVEFTCNVLAAGEDVDAAELAAMGGIAGKQMKATYYLTDGSTYRLREFLGHLGLDEAEYATLGEMVEDAPGKQFLATVIHEPSTDGQSIFARIGGTAPVEG